MRCLFCLMRSVKENIDQHLDKILSSSIQSLIQKKIYAHSVFNGFRQIFSLLEVFIFCLDVYCEF